MPYKRENDSECGIKTNPCIPSLFLYQRFTALANVQCAWAYQNTLGSDIFRRKSSISNFPDIEVRYNFHHFLVIAGKFISGMVVIVHLKLTRN